MTAFLEHPDVTLHHGDAGAVLSTLPAESVDCVVTSPPYFGLRDYGWEGQIGLEDTPAAFVTRLVAVFEEVRRVLAPHGTCWVNMGDSYASAPVGSFNGGGAHAGRDMSGIATSGSIDKAKAAGVAPKNLLGIPWRLAFGLQDAGWWLRSDVIWAKPNPMPESVTDRPTSAHEHVFLLTKAPRYYWDAEGVREPGSGVLDGGAYAPPGQTPHSNARASKRRTVRPGVDTNGGGQGSGAMTFPATGRNARNVWTIPTEPNPEAHFATFPRELVRRCLAAGCPERVCRECGAPSTRIVEVTAPDGTRAVRGARFAKRADGTPLTGDRRIDIGTRAAWSAEGGVLGTPETAGWTDCGHDAYRRGVVLDPFIGSGTTAVVAREKALHAVGIDGSAEYLEIAARRLQNLSLLAAAGDA